MSKKNISPEVKKFFEEIGRKNGKALYAKHGPEYFKRISAMRKIHGRQKPKPEVQETVPQEVPLDNKTDN